MKSCTLAIFTRLLVVWLIALPVATSMADDHLQDPPSSDSCEGKLPDGFLTGSQKQLTIIVPRGIGGGSHQLSTKIKSVLQDILPQGVEIAVENRRGDNGFRAIREYLELPPNGYVILQHVDDIAEYMNEHGHSSFPDGGLIPLGILQITHSQLYIRKFIEDRFTDWPQLREYAKEHELKVANVGHEGSMESLYIRELSRAYGLKLKHTPFNQPSARYMALIQDKTDLLIEQPGDVAVFIKRGLIDPIISLPAQQGDSIKNQPSQQEFRNLGIPVMERFRGFFVHGNTNPDRLNYLECVFEAAYNSAEFQRFNSDKKMGTDKHKSSAESIKYIDKIMKQYRQFNKESNTE
jgi:tripartite-type tricarboxylate transporter receptor subunit TctC